MTENNLKNNVNIRWLFNMAWRDGKRNRSRLLLFISSIILGIAALVAIYSLRDNLARDINNQAATLIGADLEISSNKPISTSAQKTIDSLKAERSEERNFASMIYFVKTGNSRLIEVRALEGKFPYYGTLETVPAKASFMFRNNQQALVDQTLMMQYKASNGDSIKIGNISFAIAGSLLRAPGQTALSASIAPVVYIPLKYLEKTGLVQRGSRIGYRFYYRFSDTTNISRITNKLEPEFEREGLNYNTIETQKEKTGRFFNDLTRYLAMVGFIALLLGCLGVFSSIQIYIKEKINSIAILRCLGATSLQSFLIFLIQIIAIGFIGSLIGSVIGILAQKLLPYVLKDVIPVTISTAISYNAILQGIMLGVVISILFSLIPLLSIRKISPLHTLRFSYQEKNVSTIANVPVYILLILFIYQFSYYQLNSRIQAFNFSIGIIGAFLLLSFIATMLTKSIRKFFPYSWNYLLRQSLANLYRPNNQTRILIVSIGLGTALICLLFLIQSLLINKISLSSGAGQPNIILFDIQSAQRKPITDLIITHGLQTPELVPIVNMRLESVNNLTAAQMSDSGLASHRRLFRMEYRVTYRDSITRSEKIAQGKWYSIADTNTGNVYISIESNFAKRNNLKIGDTLSFNVQGSMITTIVGSLREVNWSRMQTNFLVVFPKGVLENAPQFYVLLTRVASPQASASLQQDVVSHFPNVSIIDIGLVLSILDDILNKIGFVIRFMAGFSIFTGLVVLIASVLISKFQRIEESVLLRTLGASRKQVIIITALEYFFVGILATITGMIIAISAGWAIAHFLFDSPLQINFLSLSGIFIFVSFLTVLIGIINIREVVNKPPLVILRQD